MENKMGYYDESVNRFDKSGENRKLPDAYNTEIDIAKNSNNNQLKDTDPMIQKEGFLGMDDIDKMRRRKIR